MTAVSLSHTCEFELAPLEPELPEFYDHKLLRWRGDVWFASSPKNSKVDLIIILIAEANACKVEHAHVTYVGMTMLDRKSVV